MTIRESAFFFELEGARLFALCHRPERALPTRGLVLCHALGEEKYWSHRMLVGVARDLAREGVVVLRFDFRGEGDSDLEFEETGIATRVADTVRATEVLLEREPHLHSVALVGHRLGAAIAAAAAVRLGSLAGGLVLWDPVTDGRAYLLELLRSTLASRLALLGNAPTRAALLAALEAGETINVEGYGFSPSFYRELIGLSLADVLQRVSCPTLTVESSGTAPPWRESRNYVQGAPHIVRRKLGWLEGTA
jgi:alpha/beta superfamily hydrolase